MRGYKDIESEIEKLLIEELPKLQIKIEQLQTIGKVYIFLDIYTRLYLVYIICEDIVELILR